MFVDLLLSSAPSVEDALSAISGSPPNDASVSVVELVIADLSKLKPPIDLAFKPSPDVRKLKPPPVSDPLIDVDAKLTPAKGSMVDFFFPRISCFCSLQYDSIF